MLPETTLRNGELRDLVELLKAQADVRYDVVVSARKIRMHDGRLHIAGGAVRFTDDGAEECAAILAPTDICDEGLSEKLGIPRQYLRSLRSTGVRLDDAVARGELGQGAVLSDDYTAPELLLDATVNAWLANEHGRQFLVRGFRTDDPDEVGIARAFLSDRYAPIDNYDVLLAALDGVRGAGVTVDIDGADLSERNMRVRVRCPEVAAMAPILLANYRSPFGDGSGVQRIRELARAEGMGYEPGTEPVVEAGFEIRNSETGGGAFSIVPRLSVRICRNGLTIKSDAVREVHVGGRLEEGQIKWSEETQRRSMELVKAKVADAVKAFLSEGYLQKVIGRVQQQSPTPIEDPAGTIERVQKVHGFSDREAAAILDCFIRSGDVTAGGVMQAVTAAAQTVADPDRASEMEDVALAVLATAASGR